MGAEDKVDGKAERKNPRTVVGHVISSRMDKSVTVAVERLVQHRIYGKFIRRTTKIMAHDEDNTCHDGDQVMIAECQPISRRKSWRVVEIVRSASQSAPVADAAATVGADA